MQNKSNSIFSEAAKFLAENNFTKEGVKVGQTYRVEIKNIIQDVKVVKIDRNIVIYQRNHVPGTLAYQLQRMPIDDFEDSLVSK
jgi:hypothetical protein